MADGAQNNAAAAAGDWRQEVTPKVRRQVVDKIVRDMCEGLQGSPPAKIHEAAANFENKVFRESSSSRGYVERIESTMPILRLRMQWKMQGNAGQAVQGSCNPPAAAAPAAATALPRPAPQPQYMHAVIKQEQPCGQPVAQLQMQAGNFAGRPGARQNAQAWHPLGQNAGGMGAQPPPQPMMRNQQDLRANQHLQPMMMNQQDLRANQHLQPMMMNQQDLRVVNQQQQRPHPQPTMRNQQDLRAVNQQRQHPQPMMRNQQYVRVVNHQQQPPQQRYQPPHGAQPANVAVTQNGHGHPGGQSNQQYGSAGGVDWREVLFQNITLLKDAHFSELAEFERGLAAKTMEQLASASASKEEAYKYMAAARVHRGTREALRFLQLQKSSLHEGHRVGFGKYHKAVLDLVHMFRGLREKGQVKASIAAARPSLQNCGAVAPPSATNPACGGVAPYAGGMNCPQKQHEQLPVVQTVSSPPPVQNVEAGAPPATLQQNHGDNLQHEQPAVQTVCSPSPAQDIVAGAPPAALQQSHNQVEDDEVVTDSAESQVVIITNLAGGTASFGGGKCSQQKQQERRPPDERIPLPQSTTEPVSAGTPSLAQQQNQSDGVVCQAQEAGDEMRGRAEGPAPVTQDETPVLDMLLRGVRAVRSLSPEARSCLADDMGVNLKRAFGRPSASPLDIIIDEWERRQRESSGGGESGYKRRRTTYYSGAQLDCEIRSASGMFVDTEIVVVGTGNVAGDKWSTEIEFRYSAASLTPDLKLAVNVSEISARLLVPGDYPVSSPVLLGDAAARKDGVPGVVDVAFRRALRRLPEPRVIEAMARAWDSSAREAVVQFAHRLGGGTFSSRYGRWESCAGA